MKILKWPIRSFQLSREKNLPRIEDSLNLKDCHRSFNEETKKTLS